MSHKSRLPCFTLLTITEFTANGSVLTEIACASAADVNIAVEAALQAFRTTWGTKCPAHTRGRLMNKWADLMEQHADEICALEALDTGLPEAQCRARVFTYVTEFPHDRQKLRDNKTV